MRIYYEGLAHMIMEAEKSPSLLSARLRPRKAGSKVLVQTQRSREPGDPMVQVQVQVWRPKNHEGWYPRVGEGRHPGSSRESELAFPLPFSSLLVLGGSGDAHLRGWGWALLTQSIQMPVSSGNTFIDTSRNNVQPNTWASLIQSDWHIKLAITTTRHHL